MNRGREGILAILQQNRETIRSYGVRRLGLFGSYARGEASKASDLDFVVEFETKSFDAYMNLKEFLEFILAFFEKVIKVGTVSLLPLRFANPAPRRCGCSKVSRGPDDSG